LELAVVDTEEVLWGVLHHPQMNDPSAVLWRSYFAAEKWAALLALLLDLNARMVSS